MLCVDKAGNSASLLDFCDHMQGNSGLTGGFGTIDLDDPSLGNTAQAQGNVQGQAAGGCRLYVHGISGIAQLHDRALAVLFLDLYYGSIQSLLFIFTIHFFHLLLLLEHFFGTFVQL